MNENPAREAVAFLADCGALRFGSFRLKSGELSPFFFNLGEVDSGRPFDRLGEMLARGLRQAFPDATLLFGPAYKGIVLATLTSSACWREYGWDLPICYNRKEAKDHGEGGFFIGRKPVPGDRVVLIDDVLSSGGTKVEAVRWLREACGVEPVGVLVAMDRRRRGAPPNPDLPPVHALAAIDDLIRYLEARDPAQAAQVLRFAEGEGP